MRKVIIWGATGHAKVVRPILEERGFTIAAMIDKSDATKSFIPSCPLFRSDEEMMRHPLFKTREDISFVIAIGGDYGRDRLAIHERLTTRGFKPVTLVHPAAWVAKTTTLADGAQVLGMAAVSEEVRIGRHSIINTNASVDHESVVGHGCHIMPGATVAGRVEIADFCTIGSNATIFPRVKIGEGAVIGAGSVVTSNVPANVTVIGSPARQR